MVIQESDLKSLMTEQRTNEKEKSKPSTKAVGAAGWNRNHWGAEGMRKPLESPFGSSGCSWQCFSMVAVRLS